MGPTTQRARRFLLDDQQRFARLSGDFNPLHLDAADARQRLFGGVVVHGVHLVLWVLEDVLESVAVPVALERLTARFRSPLLLDVPVGLRTTHTSDSHFSGQLDGERCSVSGRFGPPGAQPPEAAVLPRTGLPLECKQRSLAEAARSEGSVPLYLDQKDLQELFPRVAARLPAIQVAQILATTRLTGMECPGLHSVFESLDLRWTAGAESAEAQARLCYAVDYSDERFSLVRLKVWGVGLKGTLSTLVRIPPVMSGDCE